MFEKDTLASSVSTFALSIASLATARAVAAALMRRRWSAVLFAPPRLRPDPGLAPPWAMVVLTVARTHVLRRSAVQNHSGWMCPCGARGFKTCVPRHRSEEHTSELQS